MMKNSQAVKVMSYYCYYWLIVDFQVVMFEVDKFVVDRFVVCVYFNAADETKTCVQSEEAKETIQDCGWETYWGKKVVLFYS